MNKLVLISLTALFFHTSSFACSMYKITLGDKTVVGCNEDAWRTTSKIWFETAKSAEEYGVAFTGSRQVGNNKYAPQSAMNEAGLVFSRLASYHPVANLPIGKKNITDPIHYLKDILHQCKNIAEVKSYMEQYDHSYFMDDVFIYIDKTGNYLVVEPYKLIEGNEANYVLSNFCPSLKTNEEARHLERYRNGEDFLKLHKPDTTINFYKALSDTMHVSRTRNGDGTILTSNWDTKNGLVNLYFYHNYDTTVQFNLSHELAKGDHMINIIELFQPNQDFIRLTGYKNPFNVPEIRVSLIFFAALFLISSILFLISYFRIKSARIYQSSKLVLSLLGLVLTGYMYILATEMNLYYFDTPNVHYSSYTISAFSYTPFLLLLAIVPIYILNMKQFKESGWSNFMKGLLIGNTVAYTILLFLFTYWGLFSVFN